MPSDKVEYDFFLAHAGPDGDVAKELYDLMTNQARVFLDSVDLMLGDDWDQALASAQRKSRITVVLVSSKTERAYYQREEIAAAIDMARRDADRHRVVPVYLEGGTGEKVEIPYGLRAKHGLYLSATTTLRKVAESLLELLRKLDDSEPRAEEPEERARRTPSAGPSTYQAVVLRDASLPLDPASTEPERDVAAPGRVRDDLHCFRSSPGNDRAAVFVHGYAGHITKTWASFPTFLAQELPAWDFFGFGYRSSLSFLGLGNPSFSSVAQMLRTSAGIEPLASYRSLAFIAHSMGGFPVQSALVGDDDLAGRTSHVFFLGTPGGGIRPGRWLDLIMWLLPDPQLRSARWNSPFVQQLRRRWFRHFAVAPHLQVLSVAASEDGFSPVVATFEGYAPEQRAIVYGTHADLVRPRTPRDSQVKLLVERMAAGRD